MEFAEQFSVDVSSVGDDLRQRFTSAVGKSAFPVVMLTYFADFLPRVRVGLRSAWPAGAVDAIRSAWNHDTDLGDVLFNRFCPAWHDCAPSIR